MQGITLAQQGHIVNAIPAIDGSGGVTSDRWKMTLDGHVTIIISIGVSAAAPTITLRECTSATTGEGTPIAFDYYTEETALGDTLGALTAATSAGITASGNNNIMYIIELDARELSDGSPWLELTVSPGSAISCLVCAIAVLTGSRYQNDQNATRIA